MKPNDDDSQSFDDEALLADLGSLGLAFKESKKDTTINKTKKDKANSKVRQEKRRPARAKPIDLDALLGGNDIKTPNFDPVVPTISDNSPVFHVNSTVQQTEAHINSYLSMKLKTVLNEVSVYIDNSLREIDNTNDILDNFIIEFRQSIREIIDFKYEELISVPTANSLIEPFAPYFLEIFKEIEQFINKRPFNGCNKIRSLRGLIATWPAIIKNTYNTSTNEFIHEVSERNITLTQYPKDDPELKNRYSQYKLQTFELKCQEEIQNKDLQQLQKQINQIEESRRKYFQNQDTIDVVNEQDINSTLRKQIARLQNVFDKSGLNSINRLYAHNIDGIIEDIKSMRSVKYDLLDHLSINYHDFRNTTMTILPAPQLPISSLPLPQDSFIPKIPDSTLPIPPIQIESDVDGPDTETTIFIEKIKRKMARIQKRATRDAESADEFLEKMKRKDKERERRSSRGKTLR